MDELTQWCEIDSHAWNEIYFEHGFVIGPKTLHIHKICTRCLIIEQRIMEPLEINHKHWFTI